MGTIDEASGPGSSAPRAGASDEEIEIIAATWINQLGLAQTDPDVWRDRLTAEPGQLRRRF